MGIIEDLIDAQEKIKKAPPIPKRIEVTEWMYQVLKVKSDGNKILYGCDKPDPFGFGGGHVVVQDDFTEWTLEEMTKGFKAVY